MGKKFKFTQAGPLDQKVELGGEDISPWVVGFSFDASVGELPTIRLDLSVFEVETDTGESTVHLSPRTEDLLKRLGWTPPEETS